MSKRTAKVWRERRTLAKRFAIFTAARDIIYACGMVEKLGKYMYCPLPKGSK